ncbi:CDP-alcohol phosphatidyltransferase [Prevotella sp. khp7]|uniref:serine hydrolase n=1 Tax=Prevotella sp. khp7 TaxID=1761885 RepID=UPI0008C954B6|nr:serine hydrolase [Prevotella sp. khp7]SEW29489.1 CDP-alcohol phosphatidyltransferase [Prevotella sp. khp7]
MKHLPNIISVLRIAGSLGLLLCDVTGLVFWIIYALCGISDIVDGWLARKLKCVTKKGALLDSVADICFVACCAWKLLPILELPQWLWLWAGVIVVIKAVNQLSALVMYGCFQFPHTLANKATGFMLFIAVPMTFVSVIPITIVAAIATFAAVQEGHFIRTRDNMRKIVTLVCALVVTSCWAQELISDSTSYGACIMRDGSVSGVNQNERFAMHSVMKFPQALYVADYLGRKGLALDDTIVVDKADLMQDTWSPMLKRFEGKGAISYAELLELSLGQSDNNACELLFKYCGKPKIVEKYMRKLGCRDIHVRMTEEQMHKNPAKAIENSSTPAEMVRLFEWFYHHKDNNQYLTFIWKAMADCSTGLKRIPAAIPAGARIVHKTGTGFPSPERVQDMNDAGIILMPDGSYAIIAVFTTHSPSEAVIENIAKQLLEQ